MVAEHNFVDMVNQRNNALARAKKFEYAFNKLRQKHRAETTKFAAALQQKAHENEDLKNQLKKTESLAEQQESDWSNDVDKLEKELEQAKQSAEEKSAVINELKTEMGNNKRKIEVLEVIEVTVGVLERQIQSALCGHNSEGQPSKKKRKLDVKSESDQDQS